MAGRSRVSSERDEVTKAARELALLASKFRILSKQEAAPALAAIEAHFVKEAGHHWWWEAFRDLPMARTHFADGTGWSHLSQIVPPESGLVWFVLESSPECWAFEYYVVAQSLDWLVCENHHDVVYAVGKAVAEKLARVAS